MGFAVEKSIFVVHVPVTSTNYVELYSEYVFDGVFDENCDKRVG